MVPFRRAASWDGVYPIRVDETGVTSDNLKSILDFIDVHRVRKDPIEVVVQIGVVGDEKEKQIDLVEKYEEEGLTWAIFTVRPESRSLKESIARVRIGPPRK